MKRANAITKELNRMGITKLQKSRRGDIDFRFHGFSYFIDMVGDEAFTISIPCIYEMTEENQLDVLKAVNEINNEVHVVKIVVDSDNDVSVMYEYNVVNKDTFYEPIIERGLIDTERVVHRFYRKLEQS